jgi:hypothetical protein
MNDVSKNIFEPFRYWEVPGPRTSSLSETLFEMRYRPRKNKAARCIHIKEHNLFYKGGMYCEQVS